MIITHTLSIETKIGAAIALGTFDGLHLGHKAVLTAALSSGYTPTVVTFDVHPRTILQHEQPPMLLTERDKSRMLAQMGFEAEILLDFSSIKDLQPLAFLDSIRSAIPVRFFSCGYNYRFGKEGEGDATLLQEYGKKHNIGVYVSPAVEIDDNPVSSTRIRALLRDGDAEGAARLLGRNFSYCLQVVDGDQRGRTIGFPTINQILPQELIHPRFGVYVSRTEIDGVLYPSVTNVGIRPTYLTDKALSETHIIGYTGNLYGRCLHVELLHFLRNEKKFDSLEELKNTISQNLHDSLYYMEHHE